MSLPILYQLLSLASLIVCFQVLIRAHPTALEAMPFLRLSLLAAEFAVVFVVVNFAAVPSPADFVVAKEQAPAVSAAFETGLAAGLHAFELGFVQALKCLLWLVLVRLG